MHQLVHIEALICIEMQTALDERDDLLVLIFPYRLAEVEWHFCTRHLHNHITRDDEVEDDSSAPNVGLRGDLTVALLDFRRHVESIQTAHFIVNGEMFRHVYQLHHGDI